MTTRPMQSLVALVLAVSMTVMGYAAAVARGQTTVDGQVLVLCSGGGLVQVTLDANGEPTGNSHLCPDLAFGLMAALEITPPDVAAPTDVISEALLPLVVAERRDQARVVSQARGPPVRL